MTQPLGVSEYETQAIAQSVQSSIPTINQLEQNMPEPEDDKPQLPSKGVRCTCPSGLPTPLPTERSNIDSTRQQLAAAYTNYQLLMYWSIGTRINQDILGGKRAEYGAQIVSTLSTQLTWSHVIEILPLKEALQREFYLTMASSIIK